MRYNVVIFGVKDITAAFAAYVERNICHVDLIVTIDEAIPQSFVVSGYGKMDELESKGVKVFKTDSYGLKSEAAEAFFRQNEFGIGISMNWSRLIPGWILARFDAGVFGLHGSCGYLPFGQGRATLNWSILAGEERFVMHMFKLDAGVDSPNVYGRVMFEVNEYDDIRTLQFKDLVASQQLAGRLLADYLGGKPLVTRMQDKDKQMVYPGRKPEDGRIDMQARTREICRLVRAVTHPFPGAFAYVGAEKVLIWQAQPFDRMLDFSGFYTGEVIDVLDGAPVVRTVDGSFIIRDYEAARPLQRGDILA